MNIREIVDSKTIDVLDDYQMFTVYAMSQFKYDLNKISNVHAKHKRKWVAKELDKRSLEDSTHFYHEIGMLKDGENMDFEIDVLSKSISILELSGFTKTAQDLAKFAHAYEILKNTSSLIAKDTIEGAIRKHRSVAASAPRHPSYEEAMDIATVNWAAKPTLSMAQLIAKLILHFEGKKPKKVTISGKALRNWLKDSDIRPNVPPEANTISELIIPERWKQSAGK